MQKYCIFILIKIKIKIKMKMKMRIIKLKLKKKITSIMKEFPQYCMGKLNLNQIHTAKLFYFTIIMMDNLKNLLNCGNQNHSVVKLIVITYLDEVLQMIKEN